MWRRLPPPPSQLWQVTSVVSSKLHCPSCLLNRALHKSALPPLLLLPAANVGTAAAQTVAAKAQEAGQATAEAAGGRLPAAPRSSV